MAKPLLSVIIPTLNEEKFLPQLLSSLTFQTRKYFEVIVVDGSSRDRTVAMAKRFAKKLPSLKVIISQKASLPLQRNLGAQASQGEWLVFADADGVLLPYFMERVENFIEESRHPTVFTVWFRPDSEVSGDALLTLLFDLAIEGSLVFRRPLSPGPLTVVHRRAFAAVGGYDETHAFNEDLDFSLRLDRAGYKLQVLRETLCVWSLRRLRREGTLKIVQTYAKAALVAIFTSRATKSMPGYLMGGHFYRQQKKPLKRSILKTYEVKFKKLMKELFS